MNNFFVAPSITARNNAIAQQRQQRQANDLLNQSRSIANERDAFVNQNMGADREMQIAGLRQQAIGEIEASLRAAPPGQKGALLQRATPYLQAMGVDPASFGDVETAFPAPVAQSGMPASVQEWEYYNSLSPENQSRYLTMKRSDKYLTTSAGGVQRAVPGGTETETVISDESALSGAEEKARSAARGSAAGKKDVEKAAAQENKAELQELASSILEDKDAIRAVYGSIGGLLPSVRQGTVDAELQIQRLVDMLTLENTSKMSGVLSESDIKILQRAGTVLGNFRLSEDQAIKELEKVAGILETADLVNQYAD